MSSVTIDKQYHWFWHIFLPEMFHKIIQHLQIDVPIDVTLGGDRAAPPSSDSSNGKVFDVLVPIPLTSVHQADTDVLSIGGGGDGGGDVELTVSARVVHRPIPPLLCQDTLVFHAGTERSLILVIIIIIFQIHNDITKPG